MDKLIDGFPAQLQEAISIGEKGVFTKPHHPIHNVLIAGLGGSGIGGTIVSQLTAGEIEVPVLVSKGYELPSFVNKHTLLIISSYSGNTEETLSAYEKGIESGAKIACVSSGGKVLEMAKSHKHDFLQIPGGMPPRSCLGYSLTQLFYLLHGYGLISDRYQKDLVEAVALIIDQKEKIQEEAKKVANELYQRIPIIYSSDRFEGVAIRFRQQINENSKMLCWHHTIPEMNHNELVGWRKKSDEWAVVIFRNHDDHSKIKQRIEINKEIIKQYCSHIIEVYSQGNSLIEQSIYLIHLGDWISWYLAQLNKVDATEVKVIDYLKSSLAKT